MEEDVFFNISSAENYVSGGELKATIVNFGKKTQQLMISENMEFANFSLHSSNLEINPFAPPSALSVIAKKFKSHAFIIDLPALVFTSPSLTVFFEKSFSVRIGAGKKTFVQGRHLALLTLSRNKAHLDEKSKNISRSLLNSIRLTYGIGSAGPTIYSSTFDLYENKTSFTAENHVFNEEIGQGLDQPCYLQFLHGIPAKFRTPILSLDADLLFNRALEERDPKTRFLFLWLCLESMFDSKARMKIFRDDLSSHDLNSEVFRLFQLRCKLAHEGAADITANDCTSVLWAICTATLPIKSAQLKSANSYAAWVKLNNLGASPVQP